MITHLDEIVTAAVARGKKRLAVAYGQDSHTIEAVYNAWQEGLVEATLYGDKATIETTCKELNIDPNIFNIVHEPNDTNCVRLTDEGLGIYRQVYARYPEQGGWLVPSKGCAYSRGYC